MAVRLHVAAVAHDDLRRAGDLRFLGAVYRRKLFIDNAHEFFRPFECFLIARADERHRVAEILRDLSLADERGLVLLDVADVLLTGNILRRQHAHNARKLLRLLRADIEHAGARIFAAHRAAVTHAVNINVVGIFPVALHLFGNINAMHARADLKILLLLGDLSFAQDLCREQDTVDNLDIARAAADVVANGEGRLLARGIGVLVKKRLGRDHHTGNTKAALHRARLAESISEGFLFKVRKSLDRDDVLSLQLVGLRDTGLGRLAVDEDMAGAARALAAAIFYARQAQLIAQKANEFLIFLHRDRCTVDNKCSHFRSPVRKKIANITIILVA